MLEHFLKPYGSPVLIILDYYGSKYQNLFGTPTFCFQNQTSLRTNGKELGARCETLRSSFPDT